MTVSASISFPPASRTPVAPLLKTHGVDKGLTANGEGVMTPDFVGQVGESCAEARAVFDIHRKSANAKLLRAIDIVDLGKPRSLCRLAESFCLRETPPSDVRLNLGPLERSDDRPVVQNLPVLS
jgi:hypothetical protein